MKDLKVFVFGDSITFGAWDEEGGWAERLKRYLHKRSMESGFKPEYDPYILGVSGDKTEDVLARIEPEINARTSEDENRLIILAIGLNDSQFLGDSKSMRTEPGEFEENLHKLLKIARKYAERVAIVGLTRVDESKTTPIPWNMNKIYLNENAKRYDTIVEKVAKEGGLPYIPMADVVDPNLMDDGLHPNTEGHQLMFETIKEALESAGYLA